MENKKIYVNEKMCESLGLKATEHKLLFSFLTHDEKDMALFMDKYYDGDVVKNIYAFQRHKRKQNNMSEEEFGIMFEEDGVASLEILFQEPANKFDIKYMNDQGLTYKEVYKRYTSHPNESLVNVLKGNLIEPTKRDDSYLIKRK